MSARGSARKNTRPEKPGPGEVGLEDGASTGAKGAVQGAATPGARRVDRQPAHGQPAGGKPSNGRPSGGASGGGSERIDLVVRVNKQLILGTLLVVSVCGLATHILHTYLVRRNAAEMVERATAAEKDGKLDDAERWLSQYLQMTASTGKDDPKRIDAMVTLASILNRTAQENPKRLLRVFDLHESILRQDADRDDVRLRQVRLALLIGNSRDALVHTEVLRKRIQDGHLEWSQAQQAELEKLVADGESDLGNHRQAVVALLRAIRLDPAAPEYYDSLARLVVSERVKLPRREQISENLVDEKLVELFPDQSVNDEERATLVHGILDLLRERGAPRWKVLLTESRLLADWPLNSNSTQAVAGSPSEWVAALMSQYDADGDETLSRDEQAEAEGIPYFADANDDGVISRDELNERTAAGDAEARLIRAGRLAEQALNQATQLTEAERESAAAECALTAANVAVGYSLQIEQSLPEKATALIERATEYLKTGLAASGNDPALLVASATLLRHRSDRVSGAAQKTEFLKSALGHLENILSGLESGQVGRSDLAGVLKHRTVAAWLAGDTIISLRVLGDTTIPDADTRVNGWVEDLAQLNYDAALIEVLRGRQAYSQRKWAQAAATLSAARGGLADRTVRRRLDLELGASYARLLNHEARIDLYTRALRDDPDWRTANLQLAAALADSSRIDEALAIYERYSLISGVRQEQARLLLIRARRDGTDAAQLSRIQELLAEPNGTADSSRDAEVARTLLQVDLLVGEGQVERAKDVLTAAVTRDPAAAALRAALAQVLMSVPEQSPDQRLAAALEVLDQSDRELGPQRESLKMRVRILMQLPAADASGRLSSLTTSITSLKSDEQADVLQLLAAAREVLGETESAEEIWSRAAVLAPEALEPRFSVARLRIQRGAATDAIEEALAGLRQVEGADGGLANLLEATHLMNGVIRDTALRENSTLLAKALERPRELLKSAALRRPGIFEIPRQLGHLETLLGNHDQAARDYQNAIALGCRDEAVVGRVVEHLYGKGAAPEADEILKTYTARGTELSPGLSRLSSRVDLQLGKLDSAVNVASGLARGESTTEDKLFAAELQVRKFLQNPGSPESIAGLPETETFFRAVIASEPQNAAGWTAYIRQLVRLGRLNDARETIQAAAAALPATPAFVKPLTLGNCYAMLGDREHARQFLTEAVQAAPGNHEIRLVLAEFLFRTGQLKDCLSELDLIIEPANGAPSSFVARARREKALVLAAASGEPNLALATRLLNETRANSPADEIALLRTKAAVLAKRNSRRQKAEAIKVYDELAKRDALNAAERFQLAVMCDITGDWTRAQRVLGELIHGADRPDPAHLVWLVGRLTEQGELGEAAALAGRLESIEPNSLRTVSLRAMLHKAQGNTETGQALVRKFLAEQEQNTADQQFRELVQGGRAAEAIATLKQNLGSNPPADAVEAMNLAENLINDGKADAATELLQRFLKNDLIRAALLRMQRSLAVAVFEQLGDAESAERELRELAASSSPLANLLVAKFLARQGRHSEALELCDELRETIPAEYWAMTAAAVVRAIEGTKTEQMQRVEEWMTTALNAKPDSIPLLLALADLKELQGQYAEQLELYLQVLVQDPDNGLALTNAAWLQAMNSDGTKALALVERVIERQGSIAQLLEIRGIAHFVSGSPAKAVVDLQEAVFESPEPTAMMHLARAHLADGKPEQAAETLAKAHEAGLAAGVLHPLEVPLYESLMLDQRLTRR